MKNDPVFLAYITLWLLFHDKLVLTLRHIWQAEEKWSFYNVLNKHLLLDYLLYFTGSDTVQVYWRVYCKPCLNDCFICYATLNYVVFLSTSMAQRLIGISCFRLIKKTWLRKKKDDCTKTSTSLLKLHPWLFAEIHFIFLSLSQGTLSPTIKYKRTICSVRQFVIS